MRLQPISEQFKLARVGSLAQFQRFVVATAKREHSRIMNSDPKPAGFKRYVDGVLNIPEEKVKPLGIILYEYQRLDLVVQFAMETLFDKSPVLSGAYRNGHTIFLNGAPVSNLKNWKSGDDLVISNYLPYARKIELGKMTMRVPGTDHVYAQSIKIVNGRYGNVVKVFFSYRNITLGAGKSGIRYPAMVFSER